MNLDYPDRVYAQAVLESGNFNSKLFRESNNLYGMKVPYSRNNLSIGSKNGYSVYKNWRHSVIDYGLFQSSYLRNKTRSEYMRYLSNNYAEDPNYVNKLNRIINERKK